MLLKGSIVRGGDNSGCGTFKIIQLYSKKITHAGEIIRGVLHKFDPNKNKLQSKKHYMVICSVVRQPTYRHNAYTVRFSLNKVLMVADNFKKLLSTRIFGPIQRELRNMKIDPSVMHRIVLFSRRVI